jgi:putative membrane protein
MEAQLATNLLAALVFAVVGIVVLVLSFVVCDKLTPYDLWREIVEKQNVAVALLAGLGILGVAIIIAAAIH